MIPGFKERLYLNEIEHLWQFDIIRLTSISISVQPILCFSEPGGMYHIVTASLSEALISNHITVVVAHFVY